MKLMKSIPGGTLLIPMLISAILATFFPGLFEIGGMTQAFFTNQGLTYVLAAAVFVSGFLLDISTLRKVIRRYGILLLARLLFNGLTGYFFIQIFGMDGVLGISGIAFIVTLMSINPSLFLAIVNDYGDDVDRAAFGLVALVSLPFVPMFVYGLSTPTPLNFSSLIATIIPLIVGIVLGNLDKELGKAVTPAMGFLVMCIGWTVGAGMNLIDAVKAGGSGFVMAILFYLLSFIPVFLVEKFVLKGNGISSLGLSTVAGMSASFPMLMLATNPEITDYASQSAAITSLCVLCTAIFTPIIAKQLKKQEEK